MSARPPGSIMVVSEARGLAVLRLALVPIALVGESENAAGVSSRAFPWVVGAIAVYAVLSLAVTFTGLGERPLAPMQALLDLAFVSLLVYTSGGVRSPLKYTFYVLPIAAALRLSPRLTAGWAVLSVVAYLAVTVRHPETDLPGDYDLLAGDSLSLLWVGGAAVMLSVLVGRRQQSLADLAATRRALVQQALDVEARERRRLAEALHDHAIQNVLLARQEITDVARGVPGADQRARDALDETSHQLRHEVFQMHPLGLERAGLGAVLQDLADDAARRGDLTATVDVAADAEGDGPQDLIVSTARELLANVVKHAHASTVAVSVTADAQTIALTVQDDGDGAEAAKVEQAVAQGHIGLAALVERIRAVDGDVQVHAVPGEGTQVRVAVPRMRPSRSPDGQD